MGTHLYVCDKGPPMVVATQGAPPRWITCPACATFECDRCDGAQLEGEAEQFADGRSVLFRCEAGHEKTLRIPASGGVPESASCVECDGMMLVVRS